MTLVGWNLHVVASQVIDQAPRETLGIARNGMGRASTWYATSLAQMPKLMRNSGWPKAAEMQERWLNSTALAYKQTPGSEKLRLDCRIITTKWLRTQRGSNMIKDQVAIAAHGFRGGGLDHRSLERIARQSLGKVRQGSSASFPTGGLAKLNAEVASLHGKQAKKAWSVEKWTYRVLKCNSSYSYLNPDDVDGALGVFYFWVIPSGTVTRTDNQLRFVIDRIGWCVWDSFDFGKGFNDDQVLGMWDFDDMEHTWFPISRHNGIANRKTDPAFRRVEGNWWIFNSTYRAFQSTWRRGEDFVVLSDIGIDRLKRPITVSFRSR